MTSPPLGTPRGERADSVRKTIHFFLQMSVSSPDARDGRRDEWLAIEAEARAQVKSDLDRLESTPLEFGAPIAWSEHLLGRTNGFTALHQVGFPQIGRAYTACCALIPPPSLWLPMTPAIARTMEPCRYCKAEIARLAREKAA